MKLFQTTFLFLGLSALFLPAVALAQAPQNVRGRILLQVEQHGEAWYVFPTGESRIYLPDGNAAYSVLETFGLGISNADLNLIPIGIEESFADTDSDADGLPDKLEEALGTDPYNSDSDGDSYLDGLEVRSNYSPLGSGPMVYNNELINQLRGQILLQVQSRGQAWYVNPVDGKRYYLKNGEAAYQIMRYLSLGVTDDTLNEIPKANMTINCHDDILCYRSAIENRQPAEVDWTLDWFISGVSVDFVSHLQHTYQEADELSGDYIWLDSFDFNIGGEALQALYDQGNSAEEIEFGLNRWREDIASLYDRQVYCEYVDEQAVINLADQIAAGDFDIDIFDQFSDLNLNCDEVGGLEIF
ncbi:MAG: hypothetical protein ABH826_03925 [Patescibacteria group bacterium]|nr:thrombospondin type 3 repeat-containing protein [Patescibacteria group bacterium]